MRKITSWLAVAVLFIPFTTFADSFTWKDGASGDISTTTNWTGDVSPFTNGAASTGNIVISSGAPTYSTISLSGDAVLSVSGITAITSGGNVTLSGNTSFTLGSASWNFGSSSTFLVNDSAGTKTVTLKSGATLDTSAKDEGFVLVSSNNSTSTSPVGKMTIEAGATLTTRSAQLARGKGSNATVDLYGTWTNTGNGRFSEFGSATINVKNGGLFNLSGHLADQGAGTGTVNVESGGTLSGAFASIGTRGRGIVNILDGGTWNLGDSTQTIVYGANGGARGTICQTGGTVSGFAISFGSTDTTNGIFGGKGEYILNGGTLALSSSMYQQDAKAKVSTAKNVTGTLYLGYTTDYAATTGTGVASIKTMTNTLLKANAGTLYTTSFAQREGESTIQGSASVNIQDALPTALTAGDAGLFVKNSGLTLSGTAELKVASTYMKVGSTDSAKPATITLNDSAKLTLTGRPADDTGYLKLGTANQAYAKIVLNGNSTLSTVKPDLADSVGSVAVVEVHDSATWTNTTNGRFGSNGTFTLNQDGGTVNIQGGMLSADYSNGVAYFNVSGGTLKTDGAFGMATRGKAYLNISDKGNVELPTIRAGYASSIGSHNRIVEITQTGGTLTVKESLYLADEQIDKMPVYTISDGFATFGKIYGVDVNYEGGTLKINELHLSQTTSRTTTNKNTLDIQLSDDFDASELYIGAMNGEGTINISAEAGYLFDPNANTAIFTTTNGGAGLDLSKVTFTNTLGIPTSDWRLTFNGTSVVLGTANSLPEPATWVLLALGFGLLVWKRH